MPRVSKRKASSDTHDPTSSPLQSSATATRSVKAKTAKDARIDKLFSKYANEGIIDPDGIMVLCKDLKIEYTDIRILMLAWKLKASRLGYFTEDEWRTGLKTLGVDTFVKLKNVVTNLEKEVNTPAKFMEFYTFAFRFNLTEEKQKSIDIEICCELLNLLLGSKFRSKVDSLIDYLKIQTEYKVINMDQWSSFLRFFKEVDFSDLQKYDKTEAWPLILDNFVEWLNEKSNR